MRRRFTHPVVITMFCLLSCVSFANYGANAYAFYFVNGDYGDMSTGGTEINGLIGEELDVTRPTNNNYKARSVLNTGTLQSAFSINNFEGSNWMADADVQTEFEDNLLVTGGNPGDTVDVILSVSLAGTLLLDPQNTLDSNQYGETSMQFRMYGGNVDHIYPDWLNKSIRMTYQNNQYNIEPDGFTEGTDYSYSSGVVTVDTVLEVTAQLTVNEWQNAIFYMDLYGSVANTHLDPARQCLAEADFWDTAVVDIALAPGFEAYTLTRESGVPEPATLTLLLLGAAIARKRAR